MLMLVIIHIDQHCYGQHLSLFQIIERLEQDVKQLIAEKKALKLLAQNRRAQINELRQQLGKKYDFIYFSVYLFFIITVQNR